LTTEHLAVNTLFHLRQLLSYSFQGDTALRFTTVYILSLVLFCPSVIPFSILFTPVYLTIFFSVRIEGSLVTINITWVLYFTCISILDSPQFDIKMDS